MKEREQMEKMEREKMVVASKAGAGSSLESLEKTSHTHTHKKPLRVTLRTASPATQTWTSYWRARLRKVHNSLLEQLSKYTVTASVRVDLDTKYDTE